MTHRWDGKPIRFSENVDVESQTCVNCGQLAILADLECKPTPVPAWMRETFDRLEKAWKERRCRRCGQPDHPGICFVTRSASDRQREPLSGRSRQLEERREKGYGDER